MELYMNVDSQEFDLVLFGSTGDLVNRKILPALYNGFCANNFNNSFRIIAIGRRKFTNIEFCEFIFKYSRELKISYDKSKWNEFITHIHYINLDINNENDFLQLSEIINPSIINIFYLSTAPNLFKSICKSLAQFNLNHANARIVLEKPLGHDLESSNEINEYVAKFFLETQIYRIDHYLGKESVQNLMAIRFGNTLFEALWRRQWISNIQITIAEDIGVESRGEFYDKTGALRDMLQNHLLQLLCIVAMEPPYSLDTDTIRDEKLKVLKSLKIFSSDMVRENVVRGQYKAGAIDGQPVCAYLDEQNVNKNSMTETFVALKAEIQNWRWADVPFFLRTGKRMQEKVAEIVIQFKDLPCKIFPNDERNNSANQLIIQLQPEETVKLFFLAKRHGDTNELYPVYLDLNFNETYPDNMHRPDGYERLLLDVIRGKLTLFVRRDEQQAAWQWVEPILKEWEKSNSDLKSYIAGTWGPAASSTLLAKYGTSWHEEQTTINK